MSHPPLSIGAINEIYKGNEIEKPIVQVLGTKKLGASDRYRVLISDSATISSFTMLATQLNNLIEDGDLTDFTIIEITRYAMSNASNAGKPRRIMILLEITIKMPGDQVGGKIGNPTPLEKGTVANGTENASATVNGTASTSTSTARPPAAVAKKNLNSTINSGAHVTTTPIAALSPYQNKWVIKARVSVKSDIRKWSNSRGEGSLFSMDLVDESGEIRCTAFREQAEKFFDQLELGKIYYITRASLKPANKNFNNLKNDYEMTFTNDTEVSLCDETDTEIPMISYEFKPINIIETLEKGEIIDVLGICKEVSDVQSLTARATGKELKKRDVQLVDMSGAMVTLTLWGGQAESFEGENNPVVAAKGVRIGEFNGGKSLSSLSSSVLQVDPDLPDAHRVRGWWSTTGKNEELKSLSRGLGGGGAMVGKWTYLEEAVAKGATLGAEAEVFLCKASVNFIKADNAIYKACPIDSCNKKVIDADGSFRCEKCNKEYPNYKFRLLAQLNISDATGSLWVTAFSGEAERMFGMTAQELGELGILNHDDYLAKCTAIAFQPFTFKLRMKIEYYMDEPRLKTIVMGLTPPDYKVYNKHLLDRLKTVTDFARIVPSD